MWEVMAFGERPYWDMSGQDVSDLWLQLPDLSSTPILPRVLLGMVIVMVVVVVVLGRVCWAI